jgi:hypothetical protein
MTGGRVGIIDGTYEERRWDGLRIHDIDTAFYDDRFRHSSNIKGTISTTWRGAVLVLLMGVMKNAVEMASGYMIDDRFRHLNNITVINSVIWESVMLVLLIGRTYYVRSWDGHSTPDIKFHNDWFRRSKVVRRTDTRSSRWFHNLTLISFSKMRKVG